MRPRILMRSMVVTAILSPPAAAQQPGSVEVSGLGVYHNKTVVHDGLRGFGFGFRLGVWLPAGFEIEGQLDRTLPKNSASGNAYSLVNAGAAAIYNLRLKTGQTVYFRAGYTKLLPGSICRINGVECSTFGAPTGGLGIRVPISGLAQFRAEAMYRTRPNYDYSSFGGSMGITVITRSYRSAGGGADDDLDGVPNSRDRCKDTPRGALVDARGCPTDLDGDGVYDGIDRCPGTPPGTAVDAVGCPIKRPD